MWRISRHIEPAPRHKTETKPPEALECPPDGRKSRICTENPGKTADGPSVAGNRDARRQPSVDAALASVAHGAKIAPAATA